MHRRDSHQPGSRTEVLDFLDLTIADDAVDWGADDSVPDILPGKIERGLSAGDTRQGGRKIGLERRAFGEGRGRLTLVHGEHCATVLGVGAGAEDGGAGEFRLVLRYRAAIDKLVESREVRVGPDALRVRRIDGRSRRADIGRRETFLSGLGVESGLGSRHAGLGVCEIRRRQTDPRLELLRIESDQRVAALDRLVVGDKDARDETANTGRDHRAGRLDIGGIRGDGGLRQDDIDRSRRRDGDSHAYGDEGATGERQASLRRRRRRDRRRDVPQRDGRHRCMTSSVEVAEARRRPAPSVSVASAKAARRPMWMTRPSARTSPVLSDIPLW